MSKLVTVICYLLTLVGNDVSVMAVQHLRPGHSTETHSCNSVRSPPEELADPDVMRPGGVNITFYTKYTEAYGIPILGSKNVSDDALKRACYTVRFLFAGHAGIRAILFKMAGRFGIMSSTEVTLDFPEFSGWDPYWNDRARGLGGSWRLPFTTGAEENVLCHSDDKYRGEDIFLHEAAHGLDRLAAWVAMPGFREALNSAFRNANETGLWTNTYAATNSLEYWAEGVQSYFNVNDRGREGGNGIHNEIDTREELKAYDPKLFKLIQDAFPCKNTYLKRCESTREMENNQVLQMNCNTDDQAQVEFIERLSISDPNCNDTRPLDCLYWSLTGECEKNPAYMKSKCKASCRVCTPGSTPSDCHDENSNCAWWADNGECEKNPDYMLHNCQLSCHQCTTTTTS